MYNDSEIIIPFQEVMTMKKLCKHVSILLSFIMIISLFTIIPFEASAAVGIRYMDGNGHENTANNVTELTSSATSLSAGLYAVTSDITIGSRIVCSGDVHLILADGVTLTAQKGIQVASGNSLTIYEQRSGTGALVIDSVNDYYSGIGGSNNVSSGNITVNGGVLNVTGGYYGAGIGGGENSSGTVTVNSGKLTIYGGNYGAGIGGGRFGTGTVTINGGNVWACGGTYSSAIGGGYHAAGTVTINGGTVAARKYSSGTGIGGGASSVDSANITINCRDLADWIWADSFEGTVTLSVPVTNGTTTIPAGTVGDHSKIENTYIYPASLSVAYIDADGTIKSKANGEYTLLTNSMTSLSPGWYAVKGELSISERITCSGGEVHLILCDGCDLSVPNGIRVKDNSALTIYGQHRNAGVLTVAGEYNMCGGIGSNKGDAGSGIITINGGTITAVGGKEAAGIGGGSGCAATVIINGGKITATGGIMGAGIGSGTDNSSNVTINGGSVTAIGGDGGAGIGGGEGNSNSTVTITGGILNATGGNDASGIGGGKFHHGTVTITGGSVTAAGGSNAAGIGGGYYGNGDVTITGGTIHATGSTGIGGGLNGGRISLSWTDPTDSIYAANYSGTVTLEKSFYIGSDGTMPRTFSDFNDLKTLAGKTLTPLDADCKILWNNYNGTTLETDWVKTGQTAAYNGATPTRATDNWFSYTFSGWTDGEHSYPADVQVSSDGQDAAYTATYRANPKITVESGITHGTLTAADTFCAPMTQTGVTITPDTGYRLKSITAEHRATLTALSGTEGYFTVDYPALTDGSAEKSWCVKVDKSPAFIVMKANRPAEITGYTLTTSEYAAYTGGTANWKNWSIYGANFASDSEASRDASQWQLITSVTDDKVLGPVDRKQYSYDLGTTAPSYRYYKIEITAGKGNGGLFMSEFELREERKELELESTGETRTFTMPDECVFLSAEFEAIDYSVTYASAEYGSVTGVSAAHYGDTVSLTATPDPGYLLNAITVTGADGSELSVSNGQFIMPASDVTVTATFCPDVEERPIRYEAAEHGTVSGSTAAKYGDEVSLTITPDEHYRLKSITVSTEETASAPVTLSGTGNTRSFLMPLAPVVVNAEFELVEYVPVVEPSIDANGAYILGTKEHFEIAGKNYAVNRDGSVGEEISDLTLSYFDFRLNGDTYQIAYYTGPPIVGELVIPKTYNGKAITVLGNNSNKFLYENEKTQFTLVLNENITEIKPYTFYLLYVTDVKGDTSHLSKIGDYAFSWANSPGGYTLDIALDYPGRITVGREIFNNMNVTARTKHATTFSSTSFNAQSVDYIFTDAHTYGKPSWTWADDCSTATLKFTCTDSRCKHEEAVEATVTSEIKDGIVTYTATAEFGGNTYTDTKTAFADGLGARLVGHSISLDGDIAVNFYMELSDSVIAHKDTAYMHFTIPVGSGTTEQKMLVKDALIKEWNGKDYYVFKCRVAAKEMTSEIKAQIIDGDQNGTEYTYSVKKYADYLIEYADEREDLAAAVPLVKKILNYGAYAQIYFDKNPGTLVNEIMDETEKELGDVTITAPETAFDLPDGVTFEGATLSLKSETTLSLYFKSDTTLTFSCGDYTVETAASGGYQIARIRGIKAKHIGNTFTLTVNGGTVTYSPLNYCNSVLPDSTASPDEAQNQQDEKLQNVVKALYQYWQAADAYFPE